MIKSQKNEEITGVILAGGKSSRMGENKSLLQIDGITLIERSYELLNSIFKKVIISTNEPQLYDLVQIEKVKDVFSDLGPLCGIYSSLKSANTKKIFVISVDLPFVLPDMIRYLINYKTDEPITLPCSKNGIQYLCGLYDQQLIPIMENILVSNNHARLDNKEIVKSSLSLWNFVERVGGEIIDVEEKLFYMKDSFFNINTPEDFEYVKTRLI
ncbi:MAG: molybdenum cofactor guanylyltransferase [Ignavibacteria bacterium]|nr:molybdenum cofactor guanylyltransferase [Ignavibacteria bacterium]